MRVRERKEEEKSYKKKETAYFILFIRCGWNIEEKDRF
jgi:hypothetical protein